MEIESVVKEPDSEVAARGGSRGMLNEDVSQEFIEAYCGHL